MYTVYQYIVGAVMSMLIYYVLAIQKPVLNRISLSPGYLEMLQCDDSNQQARQSLSVYISFNCCVI